MRLRWKQWPKCSHAWYFSFKPRGGRRYRFSLDAELGRHIESKADAENEAANIRTAIHAGMFRRACGARQIDATAVPNVPVPSAVTLDQFATIYTERAIKASGKASWKDDAYLLATVRNHRTADDRRLGEWALSAITEDELEAFYAAQRAAGRAGSTLNHLVQVIKASFRWASRKGYLARSPISDDSALKRMKPAQRTRRATPEEETKLLTAASDLPRSADIRLSGLIVAALETGCRRGELLSLRWGDVNLEHREITVSAETAKGPGSADDSHFEPLGRCA